MHQMWVSSNYNWVKYFKYYILFAYLLIAITNKIQKNATGRSTKRHFLPLPPEKRPWSGCLVMRGVSSSVLANYPQQCNVTFRRCEYLQHNTAILRRIFASSQHTHSHWRYCRPYHNSLELQAYTCSFLKMLFKISSKKLYWRGKVWKGQWRLDHKLWMWNASGVCGLIAVLL